MSNIELTTMCAIIQNNKVLMIDRKKSWRGWAFPGGHLENGESMLECIIREMKEETGLIIEKVCYKGMTNIHNTKRQTRHIISNYVAYAYQGSLKDTCDEGLLKWIEIDNIERLDLAEGMEYRLPLFFSDKTQELYIEWDEENGYTNVRYYLM